MSCPACDRAELNPRTGHFQASCTECSARALANGPQFFEAGQAKSLTSAYRLALHSVFGDDWKAGHERVKAWAGRIKGTTT